MDPSGGKAGGVFYGLPVVGPPPGVPYRAGPGFLWRKPGERAPEGFALWTPLKGHSLPLVLFWPLRFAIERVMICSFADSMGIRVV